MILFIFSPFAYAYVSITEIDKRTDYPGKKFAKQAQELWDKKRDDTIVYIIGNEWEGGNLSYHLKDRPKLYMENSEIIKLCGKRGNCLEYK